MGGGHGVRQRRHRTRAPARRSRVVALTAPVVPFLVHGAERSGPPIHVLRLCRWWAHHPPGFTPEVVLARPGELSNEFAHVAPTRTARLDRRSPERVGQRALDAVGLGGAGDRLTTLATRSRVGAVEGPVIVNGATAPTVALLRMLRPTGPVLMIAHELSTGWQANITADDRRLLLDRVVRYAAVSMSVAEHLTTMGVPTDRIDVIPPAVEVPPERSARQRPADRFVIGGGGTTDWRKGPDLWLRMAHELVTVAPHLDVHFVWFGGDVAGPGAGWPLRHEIDHLGLGDRVTFLGPVDDPSEIYASMDVFVSTAREDAAPLVCAEAAGHGIPVLTFDTGGAAELVTDGGCGVVLTYPDVSDMAAQVHALLREPQRRVDLGAKGARHVRRRCAVSTVAPATERWILDALR